MIVELPLVTRIFLLIFKYAVVSLLDSLVRCLNSGFSDVRILDSVMFFLLSGCFGFLETVN